MMFQKKIVDLILTIIKFQLLTIMEILNVYKKNKKSFIANKIAEKF